MYRPSCAALLLTALLLPGSALAQTVAAKVAPSRTSGVAPLAVLFDATSTTCSGGCNAFHDLHYAWRFGDDPNAVFATTGKRKNTAFGPVAAHVFERPGKYEVLLAVTSKSGSAMQRVTIDVADPNQVWSDQRTVCFSKARAFDGCPAGAREVFEPPLLTLTEIAKTCSGSTRCLLRRGETFRDGNLQIGGTGPGMLGAFGTGPQPNVEQTAPQAAILLKQGTSDWRIMDLRLIGTNLPESQLLNAKFQVRNLLVLRTTNAPQSANCGMCLGDAILKANMNDIHDGLFAVENTWHDFGLGKGGNIAFLAAGRLALLGNRFTDSTSGEHVVRVVHAEVGVISNNILGEQANEKSTLAIRSADQSKPCTAGCQRPTREIVVSDNLIRNRSTYAIDFIGQNASTVTAAGEDILVERNFITRVGTTPNPPASGIQVGGNAGATIDDVTIRNNICHMNGWDQAHCIVGEAERVVGNTCYSSDAVAEISCVDGADSAQGNLIWAPNAKRANAVKDVAAEEDNVVATSNPFASASPDEPQEFRLGTASAARNAGSAKPHNPVDWNGFPREGGVPDAGAFDEGTAVP